MSIIKIEYLLHLKRPHLWWGGLIYLAGVLFLAYLNFSVASIGQITWITLFWIIHLFLTLQLANKSNQIHRSGNYFFLFPIFDPDQVILGRMIYNFLELLAFSTLGFLLYLFYFTNQIENAVSICILFLLANLGLAAINTFTNSLVQQNQNSGLLSAVLSIPVITPILLLETRVTKHAADGLPLSTSQDELLILSAIAAIALALPLILYPFVWKS